MSVIRSKYQFVGPVKHLGYQGVVIIMFLYPTHLMRFSLPVWLSWHLNMDDMAIVALQHFCELKDFR